MVGYQGYDEQSETEDIIKYNTVDPRYLDFAYLEYLLMSKWKSSPCLNVEI